MIEEIIKPVLPKEWLKETKYLINPTGRFVIGGPQGDCGLTGRKIIVDTYGGACPHGGGAFSGKDPSKVDRSAAYAARYVAKNIVAAGLARQCQIQVAYAIGVAKPMNVTVYTEGTGKIPDDKIAELVHEHFDLRPKGIIQMLDLLRPIYEKTAAYGHFGRDEPEFSWEKTDKAAALQPGCSLRGARKAAPRRRPVLGHHRDGQGPDARRPAPLRRRAHAVQADHAGARDRQARLRAGRSDPRAGARAGPDAAPPRRRLPRRRPRAPLPAAADRGGLLRQLRLPAARACSR